MDYCSLLIAAILFFQHFHGACADDTAETENRYTKKAGSPRCKNKPHYCRATDGPTKPKCDINSMKPCYKERMVFESLGTKHVLCDTKTDGGVWVIIQRRIRMDVNFSKYWNDYRDGFGSLDGDFWIGNDFIYRLTSAGYTDLRFDMKYNGQSYYAVCHNFVLENEAASYRMTFDGYSGNTTDNMTYQKGRRFATMDRKFSYINCAGIFKNGWWYNECHQTNPNGEWGNTQFGAGINWYSITGFHASLSFIEMKLRKPNR
ncbi:tenascin-R-like isoform X1 [Physella acuta]|uniref:tenascin-R-like isoform X1 n=1 Tax=Physella acuta TaxID=109671 RepID=UPI0027DC09CE|nr:tenascin-R-like isoform X1 [Physella acuta]